MPRRNPTLAYGYVRVSTVMQRDLGHSQDVQDSNISAYADGRGFDLRIFRDGAVSASKRLTSRPAGRELQNALDLEGGSHVIITRLDRAFRSMTDALLTLDQWNRQGVTVHILDFAGGQVDTSTAMGRMWIALVAGFAEIELETIRKRTKYITDMLRAEGRAYTGECFGFDCIKQVAYDEHGTPLRDDEGQVKTIKMFVPNEDEQAVIDLIRELTEAGLGQRSIAARLNDLGHRTRRGKDWIGGYILRIQRRENMQPRGRSGRPALTPRSPDVTVATALGMA